ncbi:MAG: PDGLE domain-containing protein [Thermomicrobiales bacterium]|nr:PDGLE domain-containing protein [Thermomicrobiales bacterium]
MTARKGWIALIASGVGLALIITLFSPFASGSPDGLERVAEDKDFLHHAQGPSFEIIPDYAVPGIDNERVATILSGIIGVLIVAVIGLAVGFGLKRLAASRAEQTHTTDTTTSAPPG